MSRKNESSHFTNIFTNSQNHNLKPNDEENSDQNGNSALIILYVIAPIAAIFLIICIWRCFCWSCRRRSYNPNYKRRRTSHLSETGTLTSTYSDSQIPTTNSNTNPASGLIKGVTATEAEEDGKLVVVKLNEMKNLGETTQAFYYDHILQELGCEDQFNHLIENSGVYIGPGVKQPSPSTNSQNPKSSSNLHVHFKEDVIILQEKNQKENFISLSLQND